MKLIVRHKKKTTTTQKTHATTSNMLRFSVSRTSRLYDLAADFILIARSAGSSFRELAHVSRFFACSLGPRGFLLVYT